MLDTLSPPILVVWKDCALHKSRGEAVFWFNASLLKAELLNAGLFNALPNRGWIIDLAVAPGRAFRFNIVILIHGARAPSYMLTPYGLPCA